MLAILEQKVPAKKVVLVDQRYPYGKKKVYMSTALIVVASQLLKAGHQVRLVDFSIDPYESEIAQEAFVQAEVIAISVVGAPYIPQTIELAKKLATEFPSAKLVVGGQVMKSLSKEQFAKLFEGTGALQTSELQDQPQLFGSVPSGFEVGMRKFLQTIPEAWLKAYLSTEFALFVSQGCIFNCTWCSASKGRPEKFRHLARFREDFEYLVVRAKSFGLERMEAYATSLDFFQNPLVVAEYMAVITKICKKHKFTFRLRALCCMNTFLKAAKVIPGFELLVKGCGLWCIGFGVDGSDETEWRRYNKTQNHTSDVARCLALCDRLGIRTEVLMIMGYPESSFMQTAKAVKNSLAYAWSWKNVVLRPHVAKTFLPGNEGWKEKPELVRKLMKDPSFFYNLDVCAFANRVTHPSLLNRFWANLSFLVLLLLWVVGKNATSPIFPQGGSGVLGWLARRLNRFMPFDR